MPGPHDKDIARTLGIDPGALSVHPIKGGFTKAGKYLVETSDRQFFAKVVDPNAEPQEARILHTEASMYSMLGALGLTEVLFAGFYGEIATKQTAGIILDYLPRASWGGPWTRKNIILLDAALSKLHGTPLSRVQAAEIRTVHDQLLTYLLARDTNVMPDEQQMLHFDQAWSPDKRQVVNSRGQLIFQDDGRTVYDSIRRARATHNASVKPQHLIMTDLNFGNISLTPDGVRFVDPVYMDIGNPGFDRTVAGINIMKALWQNNAHTTAEQQYVTQHFLTDQSELARLTVYWVACTQLPYGTEPQNAWMDFQQDMAQTALRFWQF